MDEFESCDKCKFSIKAPTEEPCSNCVHNAMDNFKPKSNADRIRSMSDEELAEFLDQFDSTCGMCIHQGECYVMNGKCRDGFLQWLKSEVKE